MSADELEARKRLNKKIAFFAIGMLIFAAFMALLPSNTPEAPPPTPVAVTPAVTQTPRPTPIVTPTPTLVLTYQDSEYSD